LALFHHLPLAVVVAQTNRGKRVNRLLAVLVGMENHLASRVLL
jgi:hypothetical protein